MKACGIVAEYNPFHNGHRYQVEEAKKRSQADVMVAVMSGNFLQRGEPALVDKWTRAEMALASGIDLVVEMPLAFSSQAADYFARGGIQILDALQVSTISFGVESGEAEQFRKAGQHFIKHESAIDTAFQNKAEKGLSYAKRMEQAINHVLPEFPLDVSQPNNQLGFSYAKEIARQGSQLEIASVERKHAGYLEESLDAQKGIASATAIRKALFQQAEKEEVLPFLSQKAFSLLAEQPLQNWNDFWPYLHYQLTVSSTEELAAIYQMEEGLEHRMKEAAIGANNFEEFLSRVKSKRMTWTRLQRLAIYVLLQITKKQMMKELEEVKAIRILGFSENGQRYLSEKKEDIPLPLLTNITQKNAEKWSLDIKAGEIYRLPNKDKIKKQDFTTIPLKNVDIT